MDSHAAHCRGLQAADMADMTVNKSAPACKAWSLSRRHLTVRRVGGAAHPPELTNTVQGGQPAAGCCAEPAWSLGSFGTRLLCSVPGRSGACAAASSTGSLPTHPPTYLALVLGRAIFLSKPQLLSLEGRSASQLPRLGKLLWPLHCKPPRQQQGSTRLRQVCVSTAHILKTWQTAIEVIAVQTVDALHQAGWCLTHADEGCSVRGTQ